jgi:hypothetical protein
MLRHSKATTCGSRSLIHHVHPRNLDKLLTAFPSHLSSPQKVSIQTIPLTKEINLSLKGLFKVMLKSHTHVGCNVSEIQNQKDEHQAFQDTAKVSLVAFKLQKH